jgi:hypothetical protein
MLEGIRGLDFLSLNSTTDTGLLPVLLRRLHAVPWCPRRVRIRATLLAIVWILPGVWCLAHIVDHAHELEPAHSDEHLAKSSEDRICGLAHDYGHWHSHPDSSPVISAEGAKKLDESALPCPAAVLDLAGATFRGHLFSATGLLTQRAELAAGPRAPPIS